MVSPIDCQEVGKGNLLKPFNDWANAAELDENENVKTALKIIAPLINYTRKFCDGQLALLQVVEAVKEHKNG